MAKSALERKREQIARERTALRLLPDSSYEFLTQPFFEWLSENEHQGWDLFHAEIMAAGFHVPSFTDDSGPRSLDGAYEEGLTGTEDDPYAGYEGSIGRAESIVDHMLTSAGMLAQVIQNYKIEQIEQRLVEIEASDLSDANSKKRALADMVKMTRIREQLRKQTRYQLPAYKVKGV